MAFGPIMRVTVGELQIELAPLTKESVVEFVRPGMQQHGVFRYLASCTANVEEDEYEWYEKVRKNQKSIVWGIWVIDGDERILIGNSALAEIETGHGFMRQATSGSMIFRKEYWGKGIASAAHKARTWYAFKHLGLHRIMSAVIQGNEGSLKALSRSGYTLVYVERNTVFVEGEVRHQDNLECLNPNDPFWSQWWNHDEPAAQSIAARELTRTVLDWAEENVELP
jgi:RimJ/RimL family protein N-acetyltransferase